MVKSSMLSCVRAVTGGAAPFGPALIENFKKKCEPHEVEFREGKTFLDKKYRNFLKSLTNRF